MTTFEEALESELTDEEFRQAFELEELKHNIGRMIHNFRRARSLTQAELANKVGSGQSCISEIETGTRAPGLVLIAKLARALNCKAVFYLESK